MKSAQDYLAEANAVVPKIETRAGIAKHGQSGVVFVDVRDSAAIQESGTIAGALRIPRGFIEFAGKFYKTTRYAQRTGNCSAFLYCCAIAHIHKHHTALSMFCNTCPRFNFRDNRVCLCKIILC